MSNPFYAAASSGLVRDWSALLTECESIKGDPDNPQDYAKLSEWLKHWQGKAKQIVHNDARYYVLPWVHPSYIA
jgi:hypothetical protein